jgi:uncharacterized protein
VYLPLDDIVALLQKIRAAGGKMFMPRTPIGEYGFIAHIKDTEGNWVAPHANK